MIDRIWDPDLRADCAARAVAMAVFRFLSVDGQTWTSIGTIAKIAGVSTSTARARLALMVTRGGLAREDRRKGNAQTSPIWRIVDADRFIACLAEPLPRRRGGKGDDPEDGVDDDPATLDAEDGAPREADPSSASDPPPPCVGPTPPPPEVDDPGSVIRGSDPGNPIEGVDTGERANVERAWGVLCAALPSSRPRRLNNDRRGKLAARIRTHGIDVVVRTFGWIGSSQHRMAVFLRERGDVDTPLWDSKFDRYAEFSLEPDVDPRALPAFERWRSLAGSTDEPTPALAAPILSAIAEVGEPDVLRVIEWVLTGNDDRAKFLRAKGVTSLAAILRGDKLRGRIDLARAARPDRVVTSTATGGPDIDLGPNAIFGRSPTDHLRRR